MTGTSANRTTGNASTEELLAVEVTDIIWHVGEPTEAPLISLTGGKLYLDGKNEPKEIPQKIKRELTTEVDYKVIEKDPLARTVTVNGAVADTTTTTITLDSNTNLRVGDTIRNKESGEFCYVYAVDSGGADISARRNLGSTTETIADDSTFVICGFAQKEGGSKASLKSQLAAPRTRKTQIFKRTFGITDTLRNVELETKQVDAWDEEMTQALVEHKKDIEFSFWWNPAADSTTDSGANTVTLTRGIISEIGSSRTFSGGGNLTEELFFGDICEQVFEFGPRRKAFFVDSKFKSRLNSWSRVKQLTKSMQTQYGIDVQEIETGHGILEVMTSGVFDKFLLEESKGYGVVLDLDRVVYKYIQNRDTKFEPDIQTPGDDARQGQYITECGVSLRSVKHHSIVNKIG